jgi:hypothetical protein
LSKTGSKLLSFYPTGKELHEIADAFSAHGVPDTIRFWSVIDVKRNQRAISNFRGTKWSSDSLKEHDDS